MSQSPSTIDFLGPDDFGGIFEDAIRGLRARGHDVGRFADASDYLASGRLGRVDVLVDVDVLQVGEGLALGLGHPGRPGVGVTVEPPQHARIAVGEPGVGIGIEADHA